ncbi:MAG: RdgB/HAM1 family non-canonical purine pyrophosphatase [Bacteroidota bacterium]
MKRKLIFASNNANKADEIRHILGENFQIMTLKEAGIVADIPEPHDSFQENALEKSRYIHQATGMDCFSEDSGLEVEALHGAPGVKSARYAGENSTDQQNIEKLLAALENVRQRAAQFKTVISLILDGKEYFFEGECKGVISETPMGNNGFGYDPVFVPAGSQKSFAEMTMDEKSAISHRKKAVRKMADFLLHI